MNNPSPGRTAAFDILTSQLKMQRLVGASFWSTLADV
jgi:hypothetical protein